MQVYLAEQDLYTNPSRITPRRARFSHLTHMAVGLLGPAHWTSNRMLLLLTGAWVLCA